MGFSRAWSFLFDDFLRLVDGCIFEELEYGAKTRERERERYLIFYIMHAFLFSGDILLLVRAFFCLSLRGS